MKLNKTITKAFVALAAMTGFAACSSDDYDMASKPNNAQVYFSNESSTTLLLEEGQNSVSVEVTRIKTDGELTVGVVSADESGLFTVANNVTFAAGESTAQLPINFDFSKLESDKDYPVTLKLQGDTCAYGDNTITVNIKYAPWSKWTSWVKGNSVYNYSLYYSGIDDEQEIEYRESMLDPTQAQLKLLQWGSGIDLVLNWNKKLNLITIAPTAFDTNANYGTVRVADTYTYLTEVLGREADIEKYRSYFDEETGRLMLNVIYYVDAGSFGNGYEYVQLPGYTQIDYSLTIADNGSYQQDMKIGQVFNMTMGTDLGSIKYAVFEGELTAEEVETKAQGIFSGDIASTQTKENGWHVVMVDQAGDYTLVALGYDNDGAWQATEAVTFTVESPIGQTWRPLASGTYTYNGEAYEGTIEGMKIYGLDEEKGTYALSPWGVDSSLYFEVDDEGDIHVISSATGEDYKPGAPIVGGDAYDLGVDEENKSYWDEEKKTLYLNVVYYVPGLGAFGYGYETFKVGDAAAKMLAKARAKAQKGNRIITAAPRAKSSAAQLPIRKLTLKKIK